MMVLCRWSVIYIGLFPDAKHHDGTAAAASALKPRQKLSHVRGRISVTWTAPERVEYLLKLAASGDDDADIDGPKLEEETKIVEVAVEKGILVVPLHLQRHPILVAVDLMRGCRMLDVIHNDFGIETLFLPSKPREMAVDPTRDERLDALHKQVTGFAAMSFIIIETMRRRFVESRSAG
jgi:hypothetical protein